MRTGAHQGTSILIDRRKEKRKSPKNTEWFSQVFCVIFRPFAWEIWRFRLAPSAPVMAKTPTGFSGLPSVRSRSRKTAPESVTPLVRSSLGTKDLISCEFHTAHGSRPAQLKNLCFIIYLFSEKIKSFFKKSEKIKNFRLFRATIPPFPQLLPFHSGGLRAFLPSCGVSFENRWKRRCNAPPWSKSTRSGRR